MKLAHHKLIALAGFAYIGSFASAQTHCTGKNEFSYFSCRIKGTSKVASICGNQPIYSRNASPKTWLIQYRFGPAGKLEYSYPSAKPASSKAFKAEHYYSKGLNVYDYSTGFLAGRASFLLVMSRGDDEYIGYYVQVDEARKHVRLDCDEAPSEEKIAAFSWFTQTLSTWHPRH